MGIGKILRVGGQVAGAAVGLKGNSEGRIAAALERIAEALERLSPVPMGRVGGTPAYPPLGITTTENNEIVAREAEESQAQKSKAEKLMKEYEDYVAWRERNVR